MNYKTVFYILGQAVTLEGVCMLLPMICALCYGEGEWKVFLLTAALCFAVATLLRIKKPERTTIYAKEGFVIVSLCWIVMSILGCLPFVFSGVIDRFIPALFEMVSGFTTTGASVISGEELYEVPKSVIFWRSFSHWIGGMGVLVFLVVILPLSGGRNLHLLKAESTGPSVSKLVPRVKSSSTILYSIYIGITLSQIVLLLFTGTNLFDSITLTFGSVGTGGFGVPSAAMDKASVQWIVTIFMILCGVDFTVYYLVLMRKPRLAFNSDEVKTYFGIILASIILISLNIYGAKNCETVSDTIRNAAFQVGSIMTTTGYTTADFNLWPEFSKTILLILMFTGACAGSTGGGVKVSRIIIWLKTVVKEIKVSAHPKSTHKSLMNGRPIAHETVRAVNVFLVSYVAIFLTSLLLISIENLDLITNATAVLATLGNIGPGLGKVGPTGSYAVYNDFSLLVLTFNMLAGRLEIFPMLILFSKHTWKK